MPAKPAAPTPLPAASARPTIAEIYRTEDWRALTRQVDLFFEALGNQRDEITMLRAEIYLLRSEAETLKAR